MRTGREKISGETGKTQEAQIEETKAKTKFSPFEQAREYVHNLGLKTEREYAKWAKSGMRPNYIPSNSNVAYKNEWISWPDWLDAAYVTQHDQKFRSFEEAREFTRSLRLEKYIQWRGYCKSGKKPKDVPSKPGVFSALVEIFRKTKGYSTNSSALSLGIAVIIASSSASPLLSL